MEYVLEHKDEADRLELQAKLQNYSLTEELRNLQILKNSVVLDAGCGSGLLSRYLAEHFNNIDIFAYDFSSQRIEQAKELASAQGYSRIKFQAGNLEKIPHEDGFFDQIVCRFVFEHLRDPLAVAKEFYRVTRKEGKVCLIDLDGILFNLYSSNSELQSLIDELRKGWKTDLHVGRKLPSLLHRAGFNIKNWELIPMQFHGQSLIDELELTRQRLSFITPSLLDIFGTSEKVLRFCELYCQEMQAEDATLFYEKFIVYAEK